MITHTGEGPYEGKECQKHLSLPDHFWKMKGFTLERNPMNVNHVGKASVIKLPFYMKELMLERNPKTARNVGETAHWKDPMYTNSVVKPSDIPFGLRNMKEVTLKGNLLNDKECGKACSSPNL